jgi:hypothetical protein
MISAEHYTCMVDLLGHAGHLLEAENFINAMPCKPHAAMWKTLLGACIIHGNVAMGERVASMFLNWSLKMLQFICCCQESMLLLAIGISVTMLNSRGKKKV